MESKTIRSNNLKIFAKHVDNVFLFKITCNHVIDGLPHVESDIRLCLLRSKMKLPIRECPTSQPHPLGCAVCHIVFDCYLISDFRSLANPLNDRLAHRTESCSRFRFFWHSLIYWDNGSDKWWLILANLPLIS